MELLKYTMLILLFCIESIEQKNGFTQNITSPTDLVSDHKYWVLSSSKLSLKQPGITWNKFLYIVHVLVLLLSAIMYLIVLTVSFVWQLLLTLLQYPLFANDPFKWILQKF